MKQQIADYTVVIEKQKRLGTNQLCYTAFVPTLGIATDADNLKKVKKEVKSLIQFHIDCLAKEGEGIPLESKNAIVTKSSARIPLGASLAS